MVEYKTFYTSLTGPKELKPKSEKKTIVVRGGASSHPVKDTGVKKTRSIPSNLEGLPVGDVIEQVMIPNVDKKVKEIAESRTPRITSGKNIRRGAGIGLVDIQKSISSIDPNLEYRYKDEILSGADVQSRLKQEQVGNVLQLFRLAQTKSGSYVAKDNQYYQIGSELEYVMSESEPGFKEQLMKDIGTPQFEQTFEQAYEDLPELKKESYHIQFNKDYRSEQQRIEQKMNELRDTYENPSAIGFLHTWTTGMLSWEDPLSLKSLYYTFTGDREKIIETKARASLDLDKSLMESLGSFAWKSATGPFATIGTTYTGGALLGAGFGSLKTVAPTIGKTAEVLFGIEMGIASFKQTYPKFKENIELKKFSNVFSDIALIGVLGYSGYRGYKTGSIFGEGRTSEYLYRIHTYDPGSIGDIQFKAALKVSRNLENVRSHRIKPLDIAQDIARMDARSAARTIAFLKSHRRTTIGGSAASYTQVEGARIPQDIDLLLPGGEKQVLFAKQFFKKTKTKLGEHLIDIHGKKFYKPGEHHLFGFRSKSPVKGYVMGGERYHVHPMPTGLQKTTLGMTKIGTKDVWLHPALVTKGKVHYTRFLTKPMHVRRKTLGKITLKHELVHQKHPLWPERMVIFAERKSIHPELYAAAKQWYKTKILQIPFKGKFMTVGEQLFRKGISSVRKETSYRHFKDIPDFITHAKSLIKSSQLSKNPIVRMKGIMAKKQLHRFINPIESIHKDSTSTYNKFIQNISKKPLVIQRKFYLDAGGKGIGYASYVNPVKEYYSIGGLFGIGTYQRYANGGKNNIMYPKKHTIKKLSGTTYDIVKQPIEILKPYTTKKQDVTKIQLPISKNQYVLDYKPVIEQQKTKYQQISYKPIPYDYYQPPPKPPLFLGYKKKQKDFTDKNTKDIIEAAWMRKHPVTLIEVI